MTRGRPRKAHKLPNSMNGMMSRVRGAGGAVIGREVRHKGPATRGGFVQAHKLPKNMKGMMIQVCWGKGRCLRASGKAGRAEGQAGRACNQGRALAGTRASRWHKGHDEPGVGGRRRCLREGGQAQGACDRGRVCASTQACMAHVSH